MSDTKLKYRMQTLGKSSVYRLTLSAEAFALAVLNSGEIAGYTAVSRCDGQWDVMVKPGVAEQLNAQRQKGEHLTDVVERTLKGPVNSSHAA